jgi:hypothetical protein
MTLGSLRRDPSHQPAPIQSILDWRGAGSVYNTTNYKKHRKGGSSSQVEEEKRNGVEERGMLPE